MVIPSYIKPIPILRSIQLYLFLQIEVFATISFRWSAEASTQDWVLKLMISKILIFQILKLILSVPTTTEMPHL